MAVDPLQNEQVFSVFLAEDFCVSSGVAEGDGISFADELVMDDFYQLSKDAKRHEIRAKVSSGSNIFEISTQTRVGTPGNLIVLDCCITMMAPDGNTYEALVMVEVEDETAAAVYLLPLAPFAAKVEYRLVGVDRHAATARFAESASVSFTRGTHITLASGEQRRVEDLVIGDRILTRGDGPKELLWIGQTTVRAVGAFAPIVIKKGVLHNENDLRLSPDHRIFVYQRADQIGAGRAEVLAKVRHLVDGVNIYQEDGGFVDYFQLLFDDHQIIYAEGIATESLLVDPRNSAAIPADVGRNLNGDENRHRYREHLNYEIEEEILTRPDIAHLLRRASSSAA